MNLEIAQKAPAIIGIPPRSLFSDVDEGRAISAALQAARGITRPLPVIHGTRVIGFARAESYWSDRTYFQKVPAQYQMAWSNYNDIIVSLSNSQRLSRMWAKTMTTAPVVQSWYDLWPVDGVPGAGGLGGAANTAIAYDNTSTGTLYMGPAVAPSIRTITSVMAFANANLPVLIPYDRVLDYQSNAYTAAAPQAMTNVAVAARYNGAGLPGMEMTWATDTVHNATASVISVVDYTDNTGAAATMPTTTAITIIVSGAAPTTTLGSRIIAPQIATTNILWSPFLPLATGTIGARSVTSYTTSLANTGTFVLALVHPLAYVPFDQGNLPAYIDQIYQVPVMERLYDGAAVCFMLYTQQNAVIANLQGVVDAAWG